MATCPTWLDPTAKGLWKSLSPVLSDRLNDSNIEAFAMLCQCYSDARNGEDFRTKKLGLDYWLRLCKEFGLTPKSQKKPTEALKDINFFEKR